ncbi:MAG: 2,3-bisphosphoglycerate-independent phosphoglycerate mutase, partial [Acidobacteriota bacterium]|nr:2,3-bisphosphoglycerate-independent phosphoglycerate mutase [Acidobacteriota bacterium]
RCANYTRRARGLSAENFSRVDVAPPCHARDGGANYRLGMTRVLLIFIDGLGIGTRGSHNPLALLGADASPLAAFEGEEAELPFDGVLIPTDACLGVEGRPQSASGQTTILTGTNAPAALGYHKQGFPNEALREIINANSIFLQLKRAGVEPVTFANAYTPRFFNSRPRWVSATTTAVEAAGLPFRTLEDLRAGRAIFQDFTNGLLIASGFDVSPRTPAQAAEVLSHIVAENRFTLYEYFITDRVGHAQDETAALAVLSNLARFVRETLARVRLDTTTVILTSDHGNIEDLSLRNHTRNPVPTLAWGAGREAVRSRVRDLADITPTIFQILTAREAAHA